PRRKVIGNAGKESGLGDAEREPREIIGLDADDEGGERGDDAPADHDARDPAPRAEPVERKVARDLEYSVADEQDAGTDAELGRTETELLIHGERRKADIGAVEVVDDVGEGQQRNDPPGDLLEYRFLLRIHRVASPCCAAAVVR